MQELISDPREIIVPAELPQLTAISKFIGDHLSGVNCPLLKRHHIMIITDEIFSNIVRHSDSKDGDTVKVMIQMEEDPRSAVITFVDSKSPFNPLSAAEPDVTAEAKDRKVGGVGLFMMKKLVDDVSYDYRDGQNILTIRKYL